MSRLDDELRNAFRREQPPVDFTARLLERVALQPAPKPSWWRRLALVLDPPKLRWVAIGAAASLLLAIGAVQYSRVHQVVVDDSGKVAKSVPAPEAGGSSSVTEEKAPSPTATPEQQIKPAMPSTGNHRFVSRVAEARRQEYRELRAEGEAAKEKLMLALAIASNALNDAQKAVHDDGLNP